MTFRVLIKKDNRGNRIINFPDCLIQGCQTKRATWCWSPPDGAEQWDSDDDDDEGDAADLMETYKPLSVTDCWISSTTLINALLQAFCSPNMDKWTTCFCKYNNLEEGKRKEGSSKLVWQISCCLSAPPFVPLSVLELFGEEADVSHILRA